MHIRSNWRAVRLTESRVEQQLRQRHVLWFHGACIGVLTVLLTWACSAALKYMGVESLALRYLVARGLGYALHLVLLRAWAGTLLGERDSVGDALNAIDPNMLNIRVSPNTGGSVQLPPLQSGGGGDFAGGGATGDFGAADAGVEGVGKLASGAVEVAASSDEGAVVVVPVVAIFLIGLALFFGAGSLLMLYFGWDALLAVAVELAFAISGTRASLRIAREGWLSAAFRLTWKPLAGAALCAALLGGTIDYFIPHAASLPQAMKIIRAQL